MTDSLNLLQRWQNGDHSALEQLIQNNLDWVRDYVHHRLGAKMRRVSETQDLVQEAMIDVLAYGPRLQVTEEKQFRALLATIVENNIRDHADWLNRARRTGEREEADLSPSVIDHRAQARSMTSPSQAADRSERADWVRAALLLMEPQDRQIIELREIEKLGFTEIGERMGLSANAARMRFARSLPKLADRVNEVVRSNEDTQ